MSFSLSRLWDQFTELSRSAKAPHLRFELITPQPRRQGGSTCRGRVARLEGSNRFIAVARPGMRLGRDGWPDGFMAERQDYAVADRAALVPSEVFDLGA